MAQSLEAQHLRIAQGLEKEPPSFRERDRALHKKGFYEATAMVLLNGNDEDLRLLVMRTEQLVIEADHKQIPFADTKDGLAVYQTIGRLARYVAETPYPERDFFKSSVFEVEEYAGFRKLCLDLLGYYCVSKGRHLEPLLESFERVTALALVSQNLPFITEINQHSHTLHIVALDHKGMGPSICWQTLGEITSAARSILYPPQRERMIDVRPDMDPLAGMHGPERPAPPVKASKAYTLPFAA